MPRRFSVVGFCVIPACGKTQTASSRHSNRPASMWFASNFPIVAYHLPKGRVRIVFCVYTGAEGEYFLARAAPLFEPHPNLADEVNYNIVQSEIEGGVFLEDLPSEAVLEIRTQNHCYTAVLLDDGSALISGHPQYCPQPVQVAIAGSTWGGSMLKQRFVGRGMHLEFCHPGYRTPIITSRIEEIRECPRLGRTKIMAQA